MRPTRLQRFFILLTALWLPLQAMAGLSMQLCRHNAATIMGAQPPQAVEEHCLHHAADTAPAAPQQAQNEGCDQCGICHLACSGYMPASELKTAMAPLRHTLHSLPVVAQASHIPEPPQYPPRRSA